MTFEFLSTVSDRALIAQTNRGDARHTLAISRDLTEHPIVGEPIRRLFDTLTDTGTTLTARAPDLSDNGFAKAASEATGKLAAPFQLTVEAAYRASKQVDAEHAELYAPRFPDGTKAELNAERRAYARGLSMAKAYEAATADLSLASAIVEGGQGMSGLPAEVFDRLRREMATGQLAERIANNAALRTAPTADDPIGGAPDMVTARANAADRLDRLDSERELLATVPTLLANVVNAVSAITGEARQAAFERLSA